MPPAMVFFVPQVIRKPCTVRLLFLFEEPMTESKSLNMAGAGGDGVVEFGDVHAARAASPSCFHTRYSALNRGAEKASRAR